MMPAVLFLEAAAPIIGRRMGAAPYGSWESPITAARAAGGVVGLSEPWLGSDGSAWWLERRPLDEGRTTLVRNGDEVTPPGFNVRTSVHEYGGGSWVPHSDTAFCSRWDDQRLYRLEPGAEPRPITPAPPQPSSVRYADGRVTPDGQTIVCVRETHGDGEPVNEIVALSTDGEGDSRVLASGRDFYACPRPSPDGAVLAYTCWDHPNMPWDGCELWVAALETPEDLRRVAGGPGESIWQPDWSPAGELHFVSDRNGFWNLYTENAQLTDERAELGHPQWLFGGSTYAFLADGSIGCIRTEDAAERLCVLRPGAHAPEDLGLELTAFGFPCLRARSDRLIFAAGSAEIDSAVQVWSAAEGARLVKRSTDDPLDPAWASRPRGIQFPSGTRTSHALYYPPANPDFQGPEGERPPLIVQSHGGPTGHAPPLMDPEILFWTSRGIGVVDVNYGGSTGFGRAYRELLNGGWGVVDVEDCVAAALHLAREGEVDVERLAVHGGSAGGYTTLCALTFHDDFAAGASYYGVADAETLAADTHKFESRYLDRLIGPYPETRDLYRERSPIHFADRMRAPVILFQGLEDEVVPPDQAETMVAALKENGVPHAYLAFEGEQHGFRKAETVIRCLEAELSFYAQVFGFEPADDIEPVAIQ
jgi:dipeptidyl aminopeptidase/acylaminoacyl peptidase